MYDTNVTMSDELCHCTTRASHHSSHVDLAHVPNTLIAGGGGYLDGGRVHGGKTRRGCGGKTRDGREGGDQRPIVVSTGLLRAAGARLGAGLGAPVLGTTLAPGRT